MVPRYAVPHPICLLRFKDRVGGAGLPPFLHGVRLHCFNPFKESVSPDVTRNPWTYPFSKAAIIAPTSRGARLQKGGVPAAPSGTATLLRLSPSHRYCPWPPLAVADFRHPRLPWLDGRCVQGPGTPIRTGTGFTDPPRLAPQLPSVPRHCNTCVAPDVRAVLI